MTIELTEQQRQAIAAAGEAPPAVVDPVTKTAYILVRAEVYERLKALLEADPDPRETYPAVDEVFREDWDDPRMAEYDRYEEHKQ
jgi:hypothetical protein